MKYTQSGYLVNKKIDQDLRLICQKISDNVPDLVSIILTGGFAKGEGGVTIKNGTIFPFNDYDIYFITENPKKESDIYQLTKILNQALKKDGHPFYGFDIFYDFDKSFFVDLHHLTLGQLGQLPPMLRYYELKNYSLLLWGQDLVSKIPDFELAEICSLPEVLRLVFNRMTNLVQFLRPEHLVKDKKLDNQESLTYFVCRAVLTAATTLLMYKKQAKFTNQEILQTTKKNLARLYPEFAKTYPQFLKDLKIATHWKLKPYCTKVEPISLWFRARDYLGFLGKYFLTDSLKIKIKSWSHFSDLVEKKLPSLFYQPYLKNQILSRLGINSDFLAHRLLFSRKYLNLLYFFRVKRLTGRYWFPILTCYPAPDLQIFASLILLLFSLNKDGSIDCQMLKQAYTRLRKIYPLPKKVPPNLAIFWKTLAENYGNIYISFFWQKLV